MSGKGLSNKVIIILIIKRHRRVCAGGWKGVDMKDIEGKTVLITGGAKGMGRALASRFVDDKAKVVLVDINSEALEDTAKELREKDGEVNTYVCDVAFRTKVYDMADLIHSDVGNVDILVNNAGIVAGGNFMNVADKDLQKTMDVNIMAYMWMIKAFMPDMLKKKQGHIVNIASAAGLLGVPGLTSYCASKHAVVGFTEALRLELKKDESLNDIHFTTVCPSYVATGMFEGVKPPRGTKWLTTEDMADKIYNAIKKDKVVLTVPFLVKITPVLKTILPISWFDGAQRLLRVDTSMDVWTGRK